MDNRLLIGFIVFLVAFLVFPIAMQKVRQSQGPEGEQSQGTSSTPARGATENPELNQPPLLNEANLIGTEWMVQVEQYKVKITLAAGGVCYATHPLAKAITGVDYLEGRWRVEYDKLHVSTSFGGQEHAVTLKISGNNLYYMEGARHERIQRYSP